MKSKTISADEENGQQSAETALNLLPLELLDVVLENSFLHWVLNSVPKQRDEDVIKALASVDVCWFQRITRRRFKIRIFQRLKDFYGKNKKISAIIRNNRNFFLENIQPNKDLFDSLLSLSCITEEQSRFIQRQRSERDKNAELCHVARSFDDTKCSTFVKCLRQNNQKTVARIVENGGVLLKATIWNADTSKRQLLDQRINELRDKTKPRSDQTEKLISQLKDDDIEILNCQLDKQIVVWFWCRSQKGLEKMQKLIVSNRLIDVITSFAETPSSASESSKTTAISICRDHFKKSIVVRLIRLFTETLELGHGNYAFGVTKLRNLIYVLSGLEYRQRPYIIHVFEDRAPFCRQKKIDLLEVQFADDIGSSEEENCLYVLDHVDGDIFKITKETDGQHKIIKWQHKLRELSDLSLWPHLKSRTMSVSSAGQLFTIYHLYLPSLMIVGLDGKHRRFIKF